MKSFVEVDENLFKMGTIDCIEKINRDIGDYYFRVCVHGKWVAVGGNTFNEVDKLRELLIKAVTEYDNSR